MGAPGLPGFQEGGFTYTISNDATRCLPRRDSEQEERIAWGCVRERSMKIAQLHSAAIAMMIGLFGQFGTG